MIAYIKSTDDAEKNFHMNEAAMYDLACFYLNNNQPKKTDYTLKYTEMVEKIKEEQPKEDITPKCDTDDLVKRLKAFRLTQSRSESKKPYMIFNDAQMMDLIRKNPKTKEELQQVSGFGPVKAEKYGDAILEILSQN